MQDTPKNDAVTDLYCRHYKIIYNHCLIMAGYEKRYISLIDDCIQEAFVVFLLDYDKLSTHPNHIGWLCTAAWNRLRTQIRKTNGHDQKIQEMGSLEQVVISDVDEALDRWIIRQEARSQIAAVHAILTAQERAVFRSYFVDDLSLAETARITGLSANSTRSAIERIRKRARQTENFLVLFFIFKCISSMSCTI